MEFFRNIQKSIYGPEFYQGLLKKSFWYSLKYFTILCLLITLLATIYLSFSLLPQISSFLENFAPTVLDYFPDELKITIKDGGASTNVQEPYFLKLPFESLKDIKMKPDIQGLEIKNLIVIDTQTDQATLEEFKNYNTLFLLNRKTMMNYDENRVVINSLAEIPDFEVDKTVISSLLSNIIPYFRFVGPLFIILVFLGYFSILFSAKITYLLFAALLILILAKIKKLNIGYKKAYQLGLHLFTAGTLYETLVMPLFPILSIPFFFTGLTLVLAFINLKKIEVPAETPKKEETNF